MQDLLNQKVLRVTTGVVARVRAGVILLRQEHRQKVIVLRQEVIVEVEVVAR